MEYIQCTHCGKRYEVSEQIRAAAGQFTTCKACDEKFLIVVHSGKRLEETKDEDVISTGGLDPSLTMPEDDSKNITEEDGSVEDFLGDEDDEGAQVLATLQAKRKKQQMMYALVALVVVLILIGGLFFLQESNHQTATMANQQVSTKVQLSAKEIDMNNVECRQAAAMQWLLVSKVMHTSYSAEAFVRMLKLSGQQTEQVHKVCKNTQVIQEIIKAATNKEKPAWFKVEIETIQSRRQR
ncbi:MAG: zinc-ribbon domain-containing protein [Ghiorsea sp.]|nr:zinc-ribbon domain-containing protein [Ghiorsea sp.]